ncbi:FGGY family carbohydrate kinase [Microbacterium azadirachtae]|uniref:ATP:glycerol 3-phosphotransferase n=1 Tax=Microbacterium azadirachtae TaxID=582680 RepID=A0A1I6G6F8_9MICO|nr:FGGY family carbohydrate kinase [Microbacterium azadirachtae]SDL35577.1 glycerol kinase [Microbacterium azadirachtae]SEF66311.1 glycerol kinase [Microbacterium azadirachtae]SEF67044.1 glycerol kinase [Microbacterium azadirachtae]SFR37740.1 glycerol kinase [Microbacterium azadirachtae]
MTTVLAIDQGTSGTKAVVVGPDGDVLALSEVSVRPTYLPGGGVEHDPHAILDSVLRAGRVAVNIAKADIDIVTLANQGETVLAWDPDTGRPLSNMIVWQDRRAESICTDLHEHASEIAQRTGLVLDPYFSAPKQAWLRRNITTNGVVTTSDSWLLHQLTGEFVTDASTASRSLVLDIDTADWDRDLLALFNLQDERLPEILACDEIAGSTSAFGGTSAVGGLVVDQQAALVAQRCLHPGEAKCTFGTGAFLLANTGRTAVRSTAALSSSIAWQQGGRTTYCLDGQVYTAASAVQWLEKLTFIDTAADLDRVAAEDSHGVLCVPALAGMAAPWWRPDATATFTGMTLSTGSEHLVRAVLEGIAAQVAELATAMSVDLDQPLQRLRVDGGLTQSRVLMQAVADLMRIPVDVYPSQHATPLGAAALARCAANPELSLDDAIINWSPSTTYEPQWSNDRATEFSARWRAVADSLS